ncbi:type II toxin-antitoxin system VapC family toxin [Luteipulveratus mongoliensis]|uniref:Ribonuclease VapC n=1 Tax=Luteipulveratus mongoliensis TaxID=571913 RepID=A0A0K1JN27_9MICO|nr:type II toxin-antitoxin system VapC family toxin [Luteipulveratus mongoliensis]AKU18119.1 hypothetical protein VV02_23395 [Luteipulveratus mongoliensis]
MTFLLDTNVLSELRRRYPDVGVVQWFGDIASEEMWISVISLGEIRDGIERLRRRDVVQAARLERWFRVLRTEYADRAIPISAEIADEWGRRMNAVQTIPVADGLIAATAVVSGLTLVTRNAADMEHTGAQVLNPFSGMSG